MPRTYIYSFLPILLFILLIGKLTSPEPNHSSESLSIQSVSTIPMCGMTNVGGIPNTLLKQSVALRSGVGQFPTPTSTKNEKAQTYFEQGMGYLHAYSLVEAARSFHEALRNDSTMVMAHVGLSRVYTQLDDDEAARKAADAAKALLAYASEREKTHVSLRFAQLKAVDSLKNQSLLNDYRLKLNGAVKRFPQDAELWLMAGNAYERYANGRGQGTSTASIAIYEKVLQLFPDHPSAHHFLIHAYEGMADYVKAREHGAAYARLSPNLAHALHMYAHDLMKTGDVDGAIAQMSQTDAIERNIYQTDRYDAMYDWHHAHNIALLSLCYQYQGRMEEAERLAKERFALGRSIYPIRVFNNKMGYPGLLIAQNRYAQALPIAESLTKAETAGERTIGHYLTGLIQVKQGQIDKARASLKAANTELLVAKKTDKTDWLVSWLEPHPRFLAALISLYDHNDREKGLADVRKFQVSAREQSGPDPWAEALFQLEMIAQAAYQLKLTEFAEESAKILAEHDPNYPGTHYALARVAAMKGDATTAEQEQKLARKGWSKADAGFLAQNFTKR
ncbi:tetratricopeptide repeat protein [Spirosoma sp.]|uniref:tetratricopeptide repeat protein n=1 Tax=Spirosoma sp. TaxID=1899569 RepID=UPI003B3AB645